MAFLRCVICIILFTPMTACAQTPALSQSDTEWASYNNNLLSDRYSPLQQITTKNVSQLKPVCSYDTGLKTSFQTGPIMVNNVLYFTSEFETFAIDASDCSEKWRTKIDYKPVGPLKVNRGAAYLDGRLFRGLLDGRLVAFDADTGKILWEQQIAIKEKGETIPAAPIAWDDKVFIGHAGSDNFGVKGRVYAFEAATGKPLWETFLVPKEQNIGTLTMIDAPIKNVATDRFLGDSKDNTWNVPEGEPITGGASWTSYTLDPEANDGRGLFYIPTANPAPDFNRDVRAGANLMTNSITVLDAQTGEYIRHHLMVPEDFHDWDASATPAVLTSQAGTRMVLAGAKDGNLHAFRDAATASADTRGGANALTSTVRTVPGKLWTQPVTTMLNTTAPLTKDGTYFCPGAVGGVQWNGPAYSPKTNATYVNSVDWCTTVYLQDEEKVLSVSQGQPWSGHQPQDEDDIFGTQDDKADGRGWLNAVDVDTGRVKWVWKAPTPLVAAVTATAGNVIFTGDLNGHFYAFDATNGKKLLDQKLGGPMGGGVITYQTNNQQRVAVATGMNSPLWPWKGGSAKMVVMGLDSKSGR